MHWLITGCSSGLELSLAPAVASLPDQKLTATSRSPPPNLAKEITVHSNASWEILDASSPNLESQLSEIIAKRGPIDIRRPELQFCILPIEHAILNLNNYTDTEPALLDLAAVRNKLLRFSPLHLSRPSEHARIWTRRHRQYFLRRILEFKSRRQHLFLKILGRGLIRILSRRACSLQDPCLASKAGSNAHTVP